ncbi:hypothetical protein KAT72_08445 [Aeromonas popoffii]|uniref:Uncharacterized protein n=1 Tax=Aeromonas popoffii TaxID=70856 RepID=A0ABS5GPK7_9GAMM|nr:hypothetical protein [Aeromonas popoffii]MBR7629060.1 hypothetical protein [Aeromonas popoffii]
MPNWPQSGSRLRLDKPVGYLGRLDVIHVAVELDHHAGLPLGGGRLIQRHRIVQTHWLLGECAISLS